MTTYRHHIYFAVPGDENFVSVGIAGLICGSGCGCSPSLGNGERMKEKNPFAGAKHAWVDTYKVTKP